jgi:hypothetical protein
MTGPTAGKAGVVTADGGGVDELVDGWRTLASWTAQPWDRPGHRVWNRLVDRLAALEEQALSDPVSVVALERVAASDDDPFVRAEARRALDPGVPQDGPARERWARHPAVALGDVALDWRPGFLLAPAGPPAGFGEANDTSRLLGSPAGPLDTWPRRTDSLALTLLLDVDLAALEAFGDVGTDELLGLPPAGRLQVFHDLQTWGDDPGDGATGAWLVRHVPVPAVPVDLPDDLGEEGRRAGVVVRLLPFVAVALAGAPTPAAADAFEHAERRLVDAVRRQAAAHGPQQQDEPPGGRLRAPSDDDLDHDPSAGRLPRLLGLSQITPDDSAERLGTVRPGVRDWQLLAAVPGVGPFSGFFGDLCQLEVWCPAADLAAGRLDTAWCLVRD